jgi:hypothetical protein
VGTLYRFGVYLLTLPTFLVGLWVILRRRTPETYALLAIIFGAMALYTFTHMEPRYRAPLEPYIIMISFSGLAALLGERSQSSDDCLAGDKIEKRRANLQIRKTL